MSREKSKKTRAEVQASIAFHAQAIANMIMDESGMGDLSSHLHRRRVKARYSDAIQSGQAPLSSLPRPESSKSKAGNKPKLNFKKKKTRKSPTTPTPRARKITPAMRDSINSMHHLRPAEVVRRIAIIYQKDISNNTVYVIWREEKKRIDDDTQPTLPVS